MLNYPALITDERTWSYQELDAAIEAYTPHVPLIATLSVDTILNYWATLRAGGSPAPLSHYHPPRESFEGKTPAKTTLLHTSGSSGDPKIVCLPFESMMASARGSNEISGLSPGDRWLLALPLFHVGGLAILFRCLLAGATAVISKLPLTQAIRHHQITHLSLVPTQLYRLMQEPPVHHLRLLLVGGAPLSHRLHARACERELPIAITYGMTEMGSQVTQSAIHSFEIGDPLPYRQLKVDSHGEIHVCGETLFSGYLGKEPQQGWFATGDIAHFNGEGRISHVTRKDHLFISGGENIYPEEIERVLIELEGIFEAYVIPVPDEEYGARPIAFLRGSRTPTYREMREHLPGIKIPIAFFPLPAHLPLGKVSRPLLSKYFFEEIGEENLLPILS